ncbi:MAG: hypothetical protein OEQ53_18775, partial [Saprospiraceae bacterium]|nr:hypothetical protein [Saprospiraceae bacterium]
QLLFIHRTVCDLNTLMALRVITTLQMGVGLPVTSFRRGYQTTLCCCSGNWMVVSDKEKRGRDFRR